METFLSILINKASIKKDMTKLDTIGPYVYILVEIIWRANIQRNFQKLEEFQLWKGCKLNNKCLAKFDFMLKGNQKLNDF